MRILDVLSAERVLLASELPGGVRSKATVLAALARSFSASTSLSTADVERILVEREALQSTGVGGGVAIPHGVVNELDGLLAAVLLCPEPVAFEAIDGAPVSIFFSVIGPKRATGEHLKTLARVSRLLRDGGFRARLLAAGSGADAFNLIAAEEGRSANA